MSRRLRPLLLAAAAASSLVLAAPAWAAEGDGDAAFKALYTREWTWRRAELAGEVGEDDTDRITDHLPKIDPAAQKARLDYWTGVMAEVSKIDPATLSPEARINHQIYREQIQVLINQQKFRDYEKPLNGDSAFWSDLTSESREPFRDVAEYERYIRQMRDFPRYFHDQVANLRAGLKRGFTPPAIVLKGRDASIASVSGAAGETNPYYRPFKAMPASIPAADQARLRAEGLAAIQSSVIPAYAELLTFMRSEYLPKARTVLAAETLPDGKAYYQSKIKEFTTTDMTADQIHQLGLAEVAKIHAQMLEVMKETDFKGDFPAFLTFLRTDPQFYPKTKEELLMRAAWIAKRFDAKAEQYFGYLPRKRFAIIPVPDDIAPYYTAGRGGPGVYLVNTYNLPARSLYNLTALTLHESAPGHAFQMPVAMEHKEQPEFRQKTYISAFGEGWALYCEKLGVEMGMYETPYDRFGMLTYQMWRAARLVVDTGIHSKGWTREQAQKFLHDNTALSDHEIETEVDRYIGWPGQALAYYIGEMTIIAGREKAEQALGQKFNIRAFHDTVLELGSVPMPVLTARIDRFIAEGGKGPYPELED